MLVNQLLINLTPLIILPIILPTIGETNYSYIVVTASLSSFFLIILDYGMNLYGTKKIAQSKNDRFRQAIFVNVTLLKIIIGFSGLIFFILFNGLIKNLESINFTVNYYIAITFHGLLPLWYFQGIERFEFITVINIISKGLFILLIILLINQQEDWINYSFALCMSNGLALLGALFVTNKIAKINIGLINPKIIIILFRKGFGYFNFNLISTVYIASSTMIMSFIGFEKVLIAEFGIAEKLVRGIRQIFNPISKVIYPFLARIRKSSKKDYHNLLIRLIALVLIIAIIIIATLNKFSVDIIHFIGVNNVSSVKNLVRLISPLILLGTLSSILVTSGLILNNKIKLLNILILVSSVGYLFILLIPNQTIERFVYAILISELMLVIGSIIILFNGKNR